MGLFPPYKANFGRVYAAYGGIFIVMALIWAWQIDKVIPDRFDIIGASMALIGVLLLCTGLEVNLDWISEYLPSF